MRHECTAALIAGVMLLIPATARAQAATGQPTPSGGTAAGPAPTSEEGEFKTRFRWGIWGEGGPYFFKGSTGGVGGVTVRLGAQLSEPFAVYAQPILLVGGGAKAGVSTAGVTESASALVVAGGAAMGEATLGDLFFIGAGPEIVFGSAGSASQSAGVGGVSQSESAASGAF